MTPAKLAIICVSIVCAALALPGIQRRASAQTATDLKCMGCVGDKDLGKKTVKSKHLKKNAVKSKHIKDGSITASDLGADAVTSGHIQDGTVGPEDLADGAKPGGANSIFGNTTANLETSSKEVESLTISAPGPGYVVAMATWIFHNNTSSVGGYCSLSDQPDVEEEPYAYGYSATVTSFFYDAASLVRTIEVPAGDTTVYLNCREEGGDMNVTFPNINAFFVPNKY